MLHGGQARCLPSTSGAWWPFFLCTEKNWRRFQAGLPSDVIGPVLYRNVSLSRSRVSNRN
jgi:hypothetical protein